MRNAKRTNWNRLPSQTVTSVSAASGRCVCHCDFAWTDGVWKNLTECQFGVVSDEAAIPERRHLSLLYLYFICDDVTVGYVCNTVSWSCLTVGNWLCIPFLCVECYIDRVGPGHVCRAARHAVAATLVECSLRLSNGRQSVTFCCTRHRSVSCPP